MPINVQIGTDGTFWVNDLSNHTVRSSKGRSLIAFHQNYGAAIFYLFMHSYSIMLETTANSDNHYKSWMYSILPNSCPHIM